MTSRDRLRSLPKAELHVHLDGSLRPSTMLELAVERGIALPVQDARSLAEYMVVDDARNLQDYLDRFALSLSVMQDAPAMERIAYELAEDHAAENTRYVEVRFCPALNAEGELTAAEALDATLAGLRRAEEDHDVRTGVIVCALRSFDAAHSTEMAELAIDGHGRGVVAFDLAGGEAGNPVRDHRDAFERAHAAGVPITIHAGEGYGPESIRQAVEDGHARRIGHGTRLVEDPPLLRAVRDAGIHLEVCMTSNVQTRVTPEFGAHPVRGYFDDGLSVSLCTDNTLMSGVTLLDEYERARDHLGFTTEELTRLARMGFEAAFVDDETRQAMLIEFDEAVAAL